MARGCQVSVSVRPDPKPGQRQVASRNEWERIVLAKSGPCRGCGGKAESFHHLVSRSMRGDDVEANLIPLCGHGTTGCHGALENHSAGWQAIANAVRHSLTPLELQYVLAKKNKSWLERYYPAGETSLCPRCRRPARTEKHEPARKRKRWVISVPDDAEDGANVLDDLLVQAQEKLERPAGTPAYFTLVEALYGFLTG